MAKFEVTTRKSGEFQFNLKAPNGQIILTSEGYPSKTSCLNGVESARRNSQDDNMYEKKLSVNGKFYFNLKAINGQVIGSSEMYESTASRDNGMASVKNNAPMAEVVKLI